MDALTELWPSLDETIHCACDICADMGQALRCADDGSWYYLHCPDCGQREDTMIDDELKRDLEWLIAKHQNRNDDGRIVAAIMHCVLGAALGGTLSNLGDMMMHYARNELRRLRSESVDTEQN